VRGFAPSKQARAVATPPRPQPSTSSSAPSPSSAQPRLTTASTSFSQLWSMSSTAPAARATDMTEGLRQELARETARRTDNEILIRELVTSNYDLNKRNGELEKQNTELNRKNDEFVSSIEAANKSNNNLTTQLTAVKTQLEQERMRRMAVESRLNRLLYGNFEDASFNQPLSHLLLCCDTVPDVSLEDAILGNGTTHGSNCLRGQVVRGNCTEDYIRSLISINRNELQDLAMTPTILGSPTNIHITLEHLLAIRMYTFGNDRFKLYVAVNAPFYDPNRTTDSLANQLPFVRLLIRSLRALGRATKFETGITVYRGASVENSPYLQQVYDSSLNNTSNNNLRPGILFRFPSFTSTSTDIQEAMAQFGDDFVYEIRLKHEVCVASILYARLNYALYIVRLAWTSAPSAVSQPRRRCC
jgi:hypothetical protein